MKIRVFKLLLSAFIIAFCTSMNAQNAKHKTTKEAGKNYPEVFYINKTDFDGLFAYKANETVAGKTNKYLAGAILLVNAKNGDMTFLKLKLDYFKNASLQVQVNGIYSTQVFVLSDDRSISYKGKFENGNVVMTRCDEDEIISE